MPLLSSKSWLPRTNRQRQRGFTSAVYRGLKVLKRHFTTFSPLPTLFVSVTSPKVTRSSTQYRTLKEWIRCSLPCVTLLMIWKHVRSAWTSCVSYSVSLCLYSYKKNESRGRTYLPRPSYLIPGNRPLFPFRLCLCLLPNSYGRLHRPTLQPGGVGLVIDNLFNKQLFKAFLYIFFLLQYRYYWNEH